MRSRYTDERIVSLAVPRLVFFDVNIFFQVFPYINDYIPELPWKPELEYRLLFCQEPGFRPYRMVSP